MKELVATMHCGKCNSQKAAVYAVDTGNAGVKHNVTEPGSMTGAKVCPDCGEKLEVKRHG